MPDNSYIDTVPLGQAGTGAAYILPQSNAIDNIDDFTDALAKDKAKAQAQKLANAQKLSAAWKENQLNIKGGTLWQPEINQRAAHIMQMGTDLQNAGVNPTDSTAPGNLQPLLQQYQSGKRALMSDAASRDEYTKQADANEKLISAQPAGYYSPESVQKYHDFLKTPLNHITTNGLQMPELQRSFDLQAKLKGVNGTPIETTTLPDKNGVKQKLVLPDKVANYNQAVDMVQNDPEIQSDVSRKTGMDYSQIGNETDPNVIKKQLDDMYRSGNNASGLPAQGINSFDDPKYNQMITTQAAKMAQAAQGKMDYINSIAGNLNDKVHRVNDKSFDDSQIKLGMERGRYGMETARFNKWQEDQQDEAGQFTIGNQNSNVVVPKSKQTTNGGGAIVPDSNVSTQPTVERGASLFGVNLPKVETIVKPSEVTDTRTGATTKNTDPFDVRVSQIQMVPVFKGLDDKSGLNGSEISARQLKEIMSGKSGVPGSNHAALSLNNVEYKPFAYGLKSQKDKNNLHIVETPVKFSYDALKGSNTKKINTATFDGETDQLNKLMSNPKFKAFTPQQKIDFIKQKYQLNFDQ